MAHAAPGAARAPRADGLQLPRAADEPGPSARAGGRRLRRADAAADGRGARAARGPGAAVPRRGRPGRAHHDRSVHRLRREGRLGPRDAPGPGGPRPGAREAGDLAGRRRRRSRPTSPGGILDGEPGPKRDVVAAQRRRGARGGGVRREPPGGHGRRPRGAIDDGRRGRRPSRAGSRSPTPGSISRR